MKAEASRLIPQKPTENLDLLTAVRFVVKRRGCCCNLSVGVALNVQFTTNEKCALNNTHTYMWRKQAIIERSQRVICCSLPVFSVIDQNAFEMTEKISHFDQNV